MIRSLRTFTSLAGFVGVLALLLALCTPAFAQLDTGTITGRVTDPTGAVVAGAQISAVQMDMNFESLSESNAEGLFRIQSLRPGPYRISVTATGFKKSVREGVDLRMGAVLEIIFPLEVGTVSDSVDVKSDIPLLETQTSSTGQVMEGDYFYKLPNYQRWEKGAMYVTPNVQTTNTAWAGSMSNFHINGGQSWQIGYFEDGQLATSMGGSDTIDTVSNSVEELKVLSTVLPAEYGHSTTGAISIVKKAGTNDLHGAASELIQTRSMVQRRFFQQQALSDPRPGFPNGVSNLFQEPDAVITGPVYLPKLYNGKNKTFFMYGGNWMFTNESQPGFWTVPTQDMLNGNFNFTGATANLIYDPASTAKDANGNWTRTALPGNLIPANRVSKVASAILGHNPFVAPNYSGTFTNTGPSGNVINAAGTKYHNYGHSFRIDHQFTPNVKAYVSYTNTKKYQVSQNTPIAYSPYDANQRLTPTVQQDPSAGLTYVITPTLISETRVGVYRVTYNPTSPYQQAMTNTFVNEAKIPNIGADWYVNAIGTGIPAGASGATQGSTSLGNGTADTNVSGNHMFREDLTKVWGSHAFKMGYEWLWENQVSHTIGSTRASFTYGATNGLNADGSSKANTGGITLADLMLGYVTSANFQQQGMSQLPEDSIHSLYFQDDWRILPNLTLNLGVRYSNESPAHMKFPGLYSVADLTIRDDVYSTYAGCPSTGCVAGWVHPSGNLYKRDNNNFQPRVGFAWHPMEKLVVRGGVAMNTLDMNNWYTNQSEVAGSGYRNVTVTQPGGNYFPLYNINDGPSAFSYPTLRADGTVPNTALPQNRGTLTAIQSDFHNPYTLNWNASVQYAVAKDYVVELGYSGSHNVGFNGNFNWQSRPYASIPDPSGNGSMMDLSDPKNVQYRNTWVNNATLQQASKPYANWGGINYTCNCISTIYHSGTAKIEKRFSSGLTFSAFYTLSKILTTNPGNLYLPVSANRGRQGFDQKHRLVSSMTYDLPMGKGKALLNKGGLMNYLAGGWSLAWNYSIYSGNPMNISISNFSVVNPATGATGGRQDYPSFMPVTNNAYLIKNPSLRDNWQDIGTDRFHAGAWTDKTTGASGPGQNSLINCGAAVAGWGNDCIVYAQSFTNGNLPQSSWNGKRFIAANLSVTKDIPIHEKFRIQYRFDYYNPFKWFNWDQPNSGLNMATPGTFGLITSLNDANPSTNGGPPIINMTLAIKF
jgi:hypothetical protein